MVELCVYLSTIIIYDFQTYAPTPFISVNDLVDVDPWHIKYLIASFLFVVSSVFILTKTIRDGHEWEKENLNKVDS